MLEQNSVFTPETDPLKQVIDQRYRMDETACVESMLKEAALPDDLFMAVQDKARVLVRVERERVVGVEPSVVGVASFTRLPYTDHGN